MQPLVASRLRDAPSSLEAQLRCHLDREATCRLRVQDDDDRPIGQITLSRGHVAWVHCDGHPEPFAQRVARDLGMTASALGHLVRSYPADKLSLMQVMARNAPLGPVELREILFEHNAAHLHELMRSAKHHTVGVLAEGSELAQPYAFDLDELLSMGEATAAGDAIAQMWDVLSGHPDVEEAWILEDEVPEPLAERWPWLQDSLQSLCGENPSFEWFGTVGETAFLALGERPYVLVATIKNASGRNFERILTDLTNTRSCLLGLALERMVQRVTATHPEGLIAAWLHNDPAQRGATWQHPCLPETLLGDEIGREAIATELFHELAAEALADGAPKGVRRTHGYDLHYRSRAGLSAVLLTQPGSPIGF